MTPTQSYELNRVAEADTNAQSSAIATSLSKLQNRRTRVSVIVVVWNARKYVLECLESLRAHCQDVYAEVIVVDNCSTDGTPEMVEDFFPEFKLIRNSENYGFAKANNIGIVASSGDIICLVNSDVEFVDDCISPMLDYLSANPSVAMVGPKMILPTGIIGRSTMRFPTIWNSLCRALGLDILFRKSRFFGGFLMSDFDHGATRSVEVLVGWFVMARRAAIDRVGLLDPQFFMYGEDVDWCYRFHQAGENLVFFSDAAALHYCGASSSNAPVRFYLEMYRANLRLWRKHRGWLGAVVFGVILAIHQSIRIFGWAVAYVFRPSQRSGISMKVKKSVAILRWLVTYVTGTGGGIL